MWWSVTLSLALVSVVTFVLYCRRRYRYFRERGVRSLMPLPPLGSFWRTAFFRKHFLDDLRDGCNAFPSEKYVGAYDGLSPLVIIKDPELIKKITVRDFEYFADHRNVIFSENDSVMMNTLVFLKGQKWKDMRGALSPAFTGSKMRFMVPFMEEISKQVAQYLHDEVKIGAKGEATEPQDLYELFTRYANDVIASCAFGYKVNSLKDKTNDFYKMGRLITNFKKFNLLLMSLFPRLSKLFGVRLFPAIATEFFQNLVSGTMRHRQDNHVTRADMIQLLMEAKSGTLKQIAASKAKNNLGFSTAEESNIENDNSSENRWTDDELAAQAFIFFIAGFDTTATALTFATHELAINPEVQEKLRAEVQRCREQHPQLSYEALQGLPYMDMVISESLRKWGGGTLILDRECQKEYVLDPPHPGGKPFVLKPKDSVFIMVNALHLDPQYFSDPQKFDPERFSNERKHEIKPFTYMPFGSGPRNCIGSRFALMELKVILYQLLLDFEIVPCEKTTNPICLAIDIRLTAVGGSWVQFKPKKQ